MTIKKLRQAIYCIGELRKIANGLHKLDENACNYGLTPRQEKREERLEKKGAEIAKELGLKFYHQGDPRGASVYLIDKTMNDSNYTNGVVIY